MSEFQAPKSIFCHFSWLRKFANECEKGFQDQNSIEAWAPRKDWQVPGRAPVLVENPSSLYRGATENAEVDIPDFEREESQSAHPFIEFKGWESFDWDLYER